MNDMLTRGGRLRHEDYVLNNKDEETDSHQLYKVGEGGGEGGVVPCLLSSLNSMDAGHC